MAGALACRADRRVPAAPPVLHRGVHHVLPHLRAGDYQRHHEPHRHRLSRHPARADAQHGGIRREAEKLEYEALARNPETAYLVSDEEYERQIEDLGWTPSELKTMAGMAIERGKYEIKQTISNAFRSFLELLFQAVGLILDTLRTFFLIVLSILGPLAFAISVYDGFHGTMVHWICQYISIYLWLPISDLFSSVLARIQVLMIEKDIAALTDPNFVPDVNNSAYIIFMLIAIVGYFTIPTVSTWVIQAAGAGNYGKQVNNSAVKTGKVAAAATGAGAGHVAGKLRGK